MRKSWFFLIFLIFLIGCQNKASDIAVESILPRADEIPLEWKMTPVSNLTVNSSGFVEGKAQSLYADTQFGTIQSDIQVAKFDTEANSKKTFEEFKNWVYAERGWTIITVPANSECLAIQKVETKKMTPEKIMYSVCKNGKYNFVLSIRSPPIFMPGKFFNDTIKIMDSRFD